MLRQFAATCGLVPALALAAAPGCEISNDLSSGPSAAANVAVPAPAGPLVYQPELVWSSGRTTHQGTGFLVQRLTGETVAVTSSHFVNFSGPALLEVRWLDMVTSEPIGTFQHSFGSPGREPTLQPLDLRQDYFLLFNEQWKTDRPLLAFDNRLNPDEGERIWFPNKNRQIPRGHELVEGTIIEIQETHLTARLDRRIETHSQSGSPFLSQKTGKVIGVFSATPVKQQGEIIYLAPARVFQMALRNAGSRPLLKDVVGSIQSTPRDGGQ